MLCRYEYDVKVRMVFDVLKNRAQSRARVKERCVKGFFRKTCRIFLPSIEVVLQASAFSILLSNINVNVVRGVPPKSHGRVKSYVVDNT